ncbi:MAG: O-antigen ligase family protein [Tepidisphaeraceae bacterium]
MMSPTPDQVTSILPASSPAMRGKMRHPWLTVACLVLLAYAVLGKGAGYIGLPPIFIGEALLAAGIVALLAFGAITPARMPAILWCVLLFGAWGLARTVPYISAYGVDALRDAVIWGYSAFAFIWFFYLVDDPRHLVAILRNYRRFATLALVGMAAFWTVRFFLADQTPKWPWADVPIIELKPGDIMVHLAGILAFWITCPAASTVGLFRQSLLALSAGIMGAYERAAMFAFVAVFCLCWAFRPGHPILVRLSLMAVLALAALGISGIVMEVPVADSSKIREISFQQFASNISGVFHSTDVGDLDDTKEWRLAWWGEIVSYTFKREGGDYFWRGKGFGVNLADDDGFQVMQDHSLRSPHNANMAILARTGVPGLALWIIMQIGWVCAMASALFKSLRRGDTQWAGLFLFLLAYWLACIINSSFDVFLEGPMGGIWFWTIFGVGLAARHIWKRDPELLRDYANPYCP